MTNPKDPLTQENAMSSPKVSVVVPVHNAERYLEQCLTSILAQTLEEIEVICVDDNSTDGSGAILEQFAKEDSRLRVLRSPGLGAGGARNIGLESAQGEYLSFLDADDFFEADMLESAVTKAEEDQSDIVIYGSWLYDTMRQANRQAKWMLQLDRLPEARPFAPSEIADRLFNVFGNYTWNKLFRASLVRAKGILFQEISRTNDLFFTCTALTQANLISVIDKTFVHYRVATQTSLQSTNDRDPLSFLKAFEALHAYLEFNGLLPQYKESFLNHLVDAICSNIASAHTLDSVRLIRDAAIGSIESKYGILDQKRGLINNQTQLKEYESLLSNDMTNFLFKQTKSLRSQLENSYWYTDWCDWKRWTMENEKRSLMGEIESLNAEISELKQQPAFKVSQVLHLILKKRNETN